MFVVGLTGGIGSGKTQATNWFASQQIQVVDADLLAREAVAQGSEGLEKLRQHFGDWILDESGSLNRSKLREFVFHDPKAKAALESVVHPLVFELAKKQLAACVSAYAVLSVPLLFEHPNGLVTLCDHTLCIDAPEHLQLKRVTERDQSQASTIQNIINAQMPRQQRTELADDVVDNSGSVEELQAKLAKLHLKYLKLAQKDQGL